MNSTTETGHSRNVSNFAILVTSIDSFGSAYNPSRDALKPTALRSALDTARLRMDAFHVAQAASAKAIAERQNLFQDFSRRITRVSNTIKSSASIDQTDAQVASLVRQLRGSRATTPNAPAVPPFPMPADEASASSPVVSPAASTRSVSHRSFDTRLDILDRLLKLLTQIPSYAPNEPDLTLAGLEIWKTSLSTANQAAILTNAGLARARAQRDAALYQPLSGLVDLATDAKTYLRAAFGTDSPEFKQVTNLKFHARMP